MHYVQFVTHRTGSGTRRDGSRNVTAIVGGAVAERLPHIDILVRSPWVVELGEELGFPTGGERLELRVANAAAFVAQKLLVLNKRDSPDAAKDLVYIHDTLLVFAPSLAGLAKLWWEGVQPHPRTTRALTERATKLLEKPTDNVRRAVQLLRRVGRPRPPDESSMLGVLRTGLETLFRL